MHAWCLEGAVIWFLLCLTAAGAFGAGLVWAQARGAADDPAHALPGAAMASLPAPSVRPVPATGDVLEELFNLRPGDVVSHLETDLCVERVTRLEGPDALVLRAEAGEDTCILVADVPAPWAAVARPVRTPLLAPPLPDTLEHGGIRYRRLRRVEVRGEGPAAARAPAQQLHLYEGPDGVSLWVLVKGADVDVLEARTIRAGTCTVWPGGQTAQSSQT